MSLKILPFVLFCLLSSLYATHEEACCAPYCPAIFCPNNVDCEQQDQHFGSAGFSGGPDVWYTITTNSYPDVVPLSQGRNKGLSEGNVYLSPTGFTIGEGGNYWVSVVAVLQNPTPDSSVLIPIFLVQDETFNPSDPSPIGGIATLDTGKIIVAQSSGILKNVVPGTRLSLVATNAGYPLPIPVTVVAWNISLFKMP